jgi:hypothetical protein
MVVMMKKEREREERYSIPRLAYVHKENNNSNSIIHRS